MISERGYASAARERPACRRRAFSRLLAAFAALLTRSSVAGSVPVAAVAPVTAADYHDNGAPPAAKVALRRALFFENVDPERTVWLQPNQA